ncbi:MAG: hypothetical protein Q8Q14_02775 [Gemmatimonadales bacterium]|nr:hypothetical protein [Gemmatimonadales bacterium]
MIGKLIIIGAGGVTLGVLAMRAGLFEDTKKGALARKKLGEQFRRLPLPHLQLVLPTTRDDLAGLDDALCECVRASGASPQMADADFLAMGPEIQKCTAALLFPEIDWPPVHSDNPSLHQYWAILEQRYLRLVLDGEVGQFCGIDGVTAPPEVTGIEPRQVIAGESWVVYLAGRFMSSTEIMFRREDGKRLTVLVQRRTSDAMDLVVDADEPGAYDLIASNGPNLASSINYPGALVVAPIQE